jgi:hypothetical protein
MEPRAHAQAVLQGALRVNQLFDNVYNHMTMVHSTEMCGIQRCFVLCIRPRCCPSVVVVVAITANQFYSLFHRSLAASPAIASFVIYLTLDNMPKSTAEGLPLSKLGCC